MYIIIRHNAMHRKNLTRLATWRGLTITLILFFSLLVSASAQTVATMHWKVGDTVREAMVYIPAAATTQPTPIVFAYHGHGGTARNMFNSRGFEKLWPEAIIICPRA